VSIYVAYYRPLHTQAAALNTAALNSEDRHRPLHTPQHSEDRHRTQRIANLVLASMLVALWKPIWHSRASWLPMSPLCSHWHCSRHWIMPLKRLQPLRLVECVPKVLTMEYHRAQDAHDARYSPYGSCLPRRLCRFALPCAVPRYHWLSWLDCGHGTPRLLLCASFSLEVCAVPRSSAHAGFFARYCLFTWHYWPMLGFNSPWHCITHSEMPVGVGWQGLWRMPSFQTGYVLMLNDEQSHGLIGGPNGRQ